MARTVTIMPGFEQRQHFLRPDLDEIRYGVPLRYVRSVAQDTAQRVAESRKRFPWKFYRGDCHSHTQHSDGIGTVAETAESVQNAGLDFQFVTDHWGVTQAPECRKHGLWVGQEPATQHHHLGILGLDNALVPEMDLLHDFQEVKRRGGTLFILYSTGWWSMCVYTEEQIDSLLALPTPFLMEIINGAGNIVTVFDYTDQSAVELWDRLLTTGRRIHAMGNTDAHSPHAIGMVWNGVLAPRCDQLSITKALSVGRSFVFEVLLLNLSVGKVGMGGCVRDRVKAGPLSLMVVDFCGLLCVCLVGDGKVRKTWHLDGREVLSDERKLSANCKCYVRVEAISIDGRRGYSNPVYLA